MIHKYVCLGCQKICFEKYFLICILMSILVVAFLNKIITFTNRKFSVKTLDKYIHFSYLLKKIDQPMKIMELVRYTQLLNQI